MDILYKILFMCIINVVFIVVVFIIDEVLYGFKFVIFFLSLSYICF